MEKQLEGVTVPVPLRIIVAYVNIIILPISMVGGAICVISAAVKRNMFFDTTTIRYQLV